LDFSLAGKRPERRNLRRRFMRGRRSGMSSLR
jgi:hypothetical protein